MERKSTPERRRFWFSALPCSGITRPTSILKTFLLSATLLLLVPVFSPAKLHAQTLCGSGTPTFNVNLTASTNISYISPLVQRNDSCCGSQNPDVCVQFIITLNPAATGIIFDIFSGAMPPGALFYQVNCGPPIPVGTPICLNGPGPHILTFCKPGNNSNQFIISSIPNVYVSADLVLNDGCTGVIGAAGYDEATVTWNSVFPGSPGAYNSYLSCSAACDTVTVTGQPGMPAYIDYEVCGLPVGGCTTIPYCDTVRVYFNPTLLATITPINPTICFGNPGTTVTVNATGGAPPYTYNWSNGVTTASNFVGPGTYTVTVADTTNCPAATATVTVTAFTATITANAGPDIIVCAGNLPVNLSGTVTGVTTGLWGGGTGTFSPSNTSLNCTYMPSAAEIAAGTVTLSLLTTNTGTCPPDTDFVTIDIHSFTAVIDPGVSNVTCNGFNNGTATVNISGGNAPFTYAWSTNPVQTTATAINLSPGNYTCTITDFYGCTNSVSVTITQPPAIVLNAAGFATNCYGSCNGQTVVIPSGGAGSFTYLWQPTGQTTAAATNLCAGVYTVTVTDINGCSTSDTAVVGQPAQIVLTTSSTPSYCNLANGSATVNPSGGVGSFTYLWQPTNQTTATASNILPGQHTVTVTDANGCTASSTVSVANTAGMTAAITSNSPALCNTSCDGSATVTANGGFSPYQYTWNTSPVQTTATASNLCAGNYMVVVTDANGCPDTVYTQITAPTPLALSAGTFPAICIGQSVTLTATASGGTPGYSYNWSPAGPTVSPAVTTTYTVTATDANGCSAGSQQVTITVHPPLSVTITGNTVTCMNTLTSLSAQASGGNGGPYTYTWQPGNMSGATVNISPSATTTYTVTATDNCTSPSATATFTITVPPMPVASFVADDSSGCGQVCVDFTNTTPNVQSVTWQFSDGFTSTALNPSHCFTVPGVHSATLIVTDNNGCIDTVVAPGAVTVYTNPVAEFAFGPQPTTILEPNICFTDQSTSDVITWYWNFDDPNDQTTSYSQNTCHSYSDTGRYCPTLIVTNSNGCFSTVTYCLLINPYFTLYVPNAFTPNADGLNDGFLPVGHNVSEDDYSLMIFDRWGNLIFESTTWGEAWDGTVRNSTKIAQIDTYVWKISVKDYTGRRHKLVGHVSIVK